MFKNYLKVFFRNTLKNPFYSSINTLGLAIGIACSIVAFLYILKETSYNKDFKNYDKIYRIGSGWEGKAFTGLIAASVKEIAPAITEQVPEVEAATRFIHWYYGSLVKYNNNFIPEVDILVTDSSVLDVFSFKILEGDPNTFLQAPKQIAITQKLSKRIFGNQNALGKTITYNKNEYEVAWIMENPKNTTIRFDALANFKFRKGLEENLRLDVFTFFRTKDYMSPKVESKIRAISDKILSDSFNDLKAKISSPIQAFSQLYLRSNIGHEFGGIGSIKTLFIFGFLALIILIIAIINYVNLLISQSEHRNKEVGIRKVVGAEQEKLKTQFLTESVLLSIFSLLLAFVFAEFFIHIINKKLNIYLSLFRQGNLALFAFYFVITIFIGIISGIYPTFVLSKYNPVKVIRGIFDAEGNSNFLKILLVIIQFTISTFLIIAIFVFSSQIKYLKNKDLGFKPENKMVISGSNEIIQKNYTSIRHELLANPRIKKVTASQSMPGLDRRGQSIRKKTDDPSKQAPIQENRVQDHFIETLGLEIVKGRSFDPKFDDSRSIIINETAAKQLNVENPIGLEVVIEVLTNRESVIVGVVKDYHFMSAKNKIDPLFLSNYTDWFYYIILEIDPDNKQETIQYVKNVVTKFDPNYYWNYHFIEDRFAKLYRIEDRLFTLITYGSGIALLLSILGLFALTSYTVSKRFKEIGIRKTFGASISNIVNKLNKDIIKWVLLTNLLAWPLAYYTMNNWLQNYPYHVKLNWIHFVLASAISFLVALITISVQAFKAARMNPVDAIKCE
ncbi:MAG: ABC transporter permease [Bacteroidales bacterium]|nr:ABC transporter permease [Bacteroidales bacterium]